ncbi:hypothetical protein BZG36_03063 [Bifiguratus adelaidae]|uniref:Uncharacterized protein n=1 Tax=Bifiguratus adelaidae TaxID=1938954 RepID=A0A261XZF0_9FUNG|nr:hypothetical protein BZG36_03063 [Bifiguratus adelaidae]
MDCSDLADTNWCTWCDKEITAPFSNELYCSESCLLADTHNSSHVSHTPTVSLSTSSSLPSLSSPHTSPALSATSYSSSSFSSPSLSPLQYSIKTPPISTGWSTAGEKFSPPPFELGQPQLPSTLTVPTYSINSVTAPRQGPRKVFFF